MRRARTRQAAASTLISLSLVAGWSRSAPAEADLKRDLERLETQETSRALVKDPVSRARRALERAHRMDLARDARHTTSMRQVAAEWLALAADLVRVARAEAEASRLEKALTDVETRIVRGRTLLEETIARRGRAEAQLREAPELPPAKEVKPPGAGPKTPPAAPRKEPL